MIRAGLEAGDIHRYGEEIARRLAGRPLDFIIGSVHYVDGLFVGGIEYLTTRDQAKGIGDYFEQVVLASAVDGYDVHGHLDVFKRRAMPYWGPFDPEPWSEPIRESLRRLIAGGRGLEINTSGVRTGAGEPCPGPTILRWYKELGGEILTLGSIATRRAPRRRPGGRRRLPAPLASGASAPSSDGGRFGANRQVKREPS